MIGWLIVLGVGVVISVLSIVAVFEWDSEIIAPMTLTIGVLGIVTAGINLITAPIAIKSAMAKFTRQKEYIENHISVPGYEDIATTTMKIELNSWVYEAQWAKEYWGMFSMYPDSIMELEPIQ